jgi:hypothetical protein
VTTSNDAFSQLMPDYLQSEDIFWLTKSGWCAVTPPDNKLDNPPSDTPTDTLKGGENEWAYVLGLSDTSNPSFPLIANGFASASDHTYTVEEALPGGVWKGKNAIVVRCDTSGAVMKVDKTELKVKGPIGATQDNDIFITSEGSNGWLSATNIVVNPKPK